ncbi:hypothetical protein [Microvirga arsenatis]|uniref:Phage ABA sandwich domain-containing protein n=1 Tax=Microvirga arsenatis TaxID=2692265 RepID=A0ABW9YUM0_9HYPH|nr:hypothetical protein [Microvirga arsenatis]NBJ13300.1 hypothetical protein [Microvirga arsenatis]NBJ24084.1 hypothetical protein [Microvirga arsenatis]
MTSDVLLALKTRLEEAKGPDRQLDMEIVWQLLLPEDSKRVFNGVRHVESGWHVEHGKTFLPYADRFEGYDLTASLDAALSLVETLLPSALITMGQTFDGIWYVSLDVNAVHRGQHRHLPLALLLALVNALIAQEQQP